MNKFKENVMEELIAEYPERYLGEPGLKLIDRQLKVGPYRFDLLFEDRKGAKLIVEIQKGTLDRVHTYKILDYFDEYKERNPDEFVEVMVVANIIPIERKRRLTDRGISYREIPASEFIDNNVTNVKSSIENVPSRNRRPQISSVENGLIESPPIKPEFTLFVHQQGLFKKALLEYDPTIWVPQLRGKYEEDVPSNWFFCFVPAVWGRWKSNNYGVHFDLIYAQAKSQLPERFRLTIGVESPLMEPYRQDFKEDVIGRINKKKIDHSRFSLAAKNRTKLLEADPIPFNTKSWQTILHNYILLLPIIDIIGEVSREYSDKGAFDTHIQF